MPSRITGLGSLSSLLWNSKAYRHRQSIRGVRRFRPALRYRILWVFLAATYPFCAIAQLSTETQTTGSSEGKEAQESRQKEAQEAERLTELYLRNQNVFLRKGELLLEVNSFYSRNTQQEAVLVPGGLAVATTTTRFWDTRLIARYGVLTDGLEVDLFVPAFVHTERETTILGSRTREATEGLGDISGAIRYQAWYERGSRPGLIIDVEGKSRTGGNGLTGTGTWSAGGGITLLKSLDPVVFFGRIGYIHNFSRPGRDLGNIIDYRVGMGFALNDRVSFLMQVTGAYVEPSQFAAVELGAATAAPAIGPIVVSTQRLEVINLLFSTTVLVTKKLFIEPVVGIGLTPESFAIIGLRIPYRF